jgi:DNA-binding SARP family transcriptional activator/tetratricopeptide (TPR) repeat protein
MTIDGCQFSWGRWALNFLVLGPLEVRSPQGAQVELGRRRRERCLVGVLLVYAGHLVTVDRLLDLLWDGAPPDGARVTLTSHVSRMRRPLRSAGEVPILRRGDGYLLDVAPEQVDLHRFTALVRQAESVRDPEERFDLLGEALQLWRGELLADVASDRLRDRVGAGIRDVRLGATEARLEAMLDCGRHQAAVPLLTDLVDAYPYRERLLALLMLALFRCGRTSDALALFRRSRGRFIDELGVEPGAELARLHKAMLRGDPALGTVMAGPAPEGVAVADVPERAVPAQLPAAPYHFVGRAAALAELQAHLLCEPTDRAPGPVVIEGAPGVGKTALAVSWAQAARAQFPDGQLFVNLRGFATEPPLQPGDALAQCLRALGVPAAEVPDDLDEAAARFRTATAGGRLLVVLDNAASAEQVRPLLPAGSGCRVVVTSRTRLGGLVAIEGAHRIVLAPLPAADAITLLRRFVGADQVDRESAAAQSLVDICGRLPLALRIAAANITADPGGGIAAYLDKTGSGGLAALSVGDDPRAAVRLAFDRSYAVLPPQAARLFRLLGLVPGQLVWRGSAAALGGLPAADLPSVIGALTDAHLLESYTPQRYAMHDLIAAYARELLVADEPAVQRHQAMVRLLYWYLAAFHTANDLLAPHRNVVTLAAPPNPAVPAFVARRDDALAFLDAERPTLPELVRLAVAEGHDGPAWQIAYLLGGYFQLRGDGLDSLRIYQVGLAAAQRCGASTASAVLHNSCGVAYAKMDRLSSAAEEFARAAELFHAAGPPTAEAASLLNLGKLALDLNRLAESRSAYERAVRLLEGSGDLRRLGVVLNNLGGTLLAMGKIGHALRHLRRSLSLHREYGNLAGEGVTLDSIGEAQLAAGDADAALVTLHAALKALRAAGYQAEEAGTLANLGRAHRRRGEPGPAAAYLRQAADRYRQLDRRHKEAQVRQELAELDPGGA